MRVSPLAAGCIAAVLGGTVVVAWLAYRDTKKLIADGDALSRQYMALGRDARAARVALAPVIKARVNQYGRAYADALGLKIGNAVAVVEFGITPAFKADAVKFQAKVAEVQHSYSTVEAAALSVWGRVRAVFTTPVQTRRA